MKNKKIAAVCSTSLLFVSMLFLSSCTKEVGCTNPKAINYDPDAEKDCCCVLENDPEKNKYSATIHFEHVVKGVELQLNTSNKPYENALGQNYNVENLKYLISDISFHKSNGESFSIQDHHFVNLDEITTLNYQPVIQIPEGDYSSISFTFGLDPQDNESGKYPDLNSIGWSWPDMMGGGYHFMQLEGYYDSAGVSKAYLTHMGAAQDKSVNPPIVENNHFTVYPDNSAITVDGNFDLTFVMHIDQWFTQPYNWDFTVFNTDIMMNYEAQRKLNINGPSVFTLKK